MKLRLSRSPLAAAAFTGLPLTLATIPEHAQIAVIDNIGMAPRPLWPGLFR